MFYSSVISHCIPVKVIGRKVKLVEAESDAYKMRIRTRIPAYVCAAGKFFTEPGLHLVNVTDAIDFFQCQFIMACRTSQRVMRTV